MPFTDTPDPITATLTDIGRMNFARAALGEISFTVTNFAVGQGGYDSTNPVHIIAIDTTSTQLIQQFFPSDQASAVYTFTNPSASVVEGAVYSNNYGFFTILATATGTTAVVASGNLVPSTSAGPLIKYSGAGDASIAFTDFDVSFLSPVQAVEFPTPKTCMVSCRLAQNDANSALGELGVWATITYSTSASEVGTNFLLALSHFPIMTKVLKQIIVYRVLIQF